MCGIAGIWLSKEDHRESAGQFARSMTTVLSHRGPDGSGIWQSPQLPLALGHRRLSIQDTSQAGAQPMTSQCGRYVLVYNGELFGFASLAGKLADREIALRGHSDTEILLETISVEGLSATLRQINGMYAIAVWDSQDRTLTLARDPLGIKPLYYGWRNENFIFGSELKSLRALPFFQHRKNAAAACEFFKVGYVPAPLTIEEDVYKLLPGHSLTIKDAIQKVAPVPFWDMFQDGCQPGIAQRDDRLQKASLTDATDQLQELLTEVVDQHLVSDVPLGAFLSGGIDSSLVVALMQKLRPGKVQTFSIGFENPVYDESKYAADVAQHLQTQHHQKIVTSEEAQTVIPLLPQMYDEPFADSSQIPTYLVSRFAREQVTVTLSGDGGDEFFGGYRRYPYFLHLWNKINRLPCWLRSSAGWGVGVGSRLLPAKHRDGALWRANLLGVQDFSECYERFNRHWKFPQHMLTRDFLKSVEVEDRCHIAPFCMLPENPYQAIEELQNKLNNDLANAAKTSSDSIFDWMMLHDGLRYLPDDILTKVDRASMACSLETRVPLLDKRVVEFSWQLPAAWKQGHNPSDAQQNGKVILRELLSRFVPRSLFERPKIGFGVPLDQWLRGPLRDWAEHLLDRRRLREQGILQVDAIHRIWKAHLDEAASWEYLLWDVLMFQACEEKS